MAGSAPKLNGTIKKFIESQPIFFVATAAAEGRVNISPKGLDCLRIINDNKIAWLNLTGSGNETAAHTLEASRMTLLFCGLTGQSMNIRVFGNAKATHPNDERWDELKSLFPNLPGARNIFELDIDLVTNSCGSSFPFFTADHSRYEVEFIPYWEEKSPEELQEFWATRNSTSLDGKPTGI